MNRRTLAIAAACSALTAGAALAQSPAPEPIPAHPSELRFSPLHFELPRVEKFAFKLKNGVPVYVAEDHSLPLVQIDISLRVGSFLEPVEKAGLASLTGTLLRRGGAGELTAEQFDEKADFLAANLWSSAGTTEASASLNCLAGQIEPSLDLLFAMLRSPRFQADRLDVEKAQTLERMKQRNDDASDILAREWGWLLYGREHAAARVASRANLDGIAREDLVAFHSKWWRPENMVIAVSGDVRPKGILAALEKRFAGWSPGKERVPWPPAPPSHVVMPGLYHVEKDIPQGKVAIGHLGSRWDARWENPDNHALIVMNDILGGGGFTSRITKRIRSDEGLAYSAGSRYGIGEFWPGVFRISFQTKSSTVALASKIAMEELRRIREEPVTQGELDTSKASFIETFPASFESPAQIAGTFADDDLVGRPHAYWETYRANIAKVTAEDVLRVAKLYLKPDATAFLIVGRWSEIEPGDANGRSSMKDFFGGQVTHLPLRDPLTLEPPN